MDKTKDIDNYILRFPDKTQKILEKLRVAIKKAAPSAEEVISYQMPAFRFHEILVYFAAYKNHIGFYPTSSGIENFKAELSDYKFTKGTIQFPLDKPLPIKLIAKIVKFRVNENLRKLKIKGKNK